MDDSCSIKSEEYEDIRLLENNSFHNFAGTYDNNEDEETKIRHLYDLLKSWNLLDLFDHFLNEHIDLEVLSVIKPHFFERLLQPFNLRTHIMFEHNLTQWRESIGHPLPIYPQMTSASFNNYRNIAVPRSSHPHMRTSYPRRPTNPPSSYFRELPPTSSRPLESSVTYEPAASSNSNPEPTTSNSCENSNSRSKVTLDFILNASLKGQMLCEVYKRHERFDERQRTLLIQLVAEYFNDKGVQLELATTYDIEKQIIARFPSEQLEFYRTSKRGRIYNKYCNCKYTLQKVARNKARKRAASSSSQEDQLQPTEFVPEQDAEEHIKNLKCKDLASNKIEHSWKACTKYRINSVRRMDSVNLILSKWPQYKQNKFIAMDFKYLHPNWDALLSNWDSTFDKLYKFLNSDQNIKSPDIKVVLTSLKSQTSKDCRDAALLWCLHGYLKPSSKSYATNEKGKRNVSSISIRDSQNALTLIARTEDDIDLHRQNFEQQNDHVYPFITVIGDSILNFTKILVCLEDVKYECDSFISALDLCYNIIDVFKMEFPTACRTVWSFIQNNFFEAKPEAGSARVHLLMNELKSINQDRICW